MFYEPPQALNDEGSYFVTNNAQTGVPLTLTAAFDATKPFLIVQNTAAAGGKKIYMDYIDLVTIAAGSAASALTLIQAAVYVDDVLRYVSAGSALTGIVSPNSSLSPTSVAAVYAGQITPAAAHAAKAVCGLRTIRPTVSGTVADVVGETKHFVFGGGSQSPSGQITIAVPNIIPVPLPPICIGPQCSMLLYLFYAASAAPVAATYAPEVGWSEK